MVRQIITWWLSPDPVVRDSWPADIRVKYLPYCILGFTAGDPGYIISKMADDGVGFVIDHLFALYSISDR